MELPEMTVDVPRIMIKRKVYEWLASARQNPKGLAPVELKPHLQYVIATDSQLLVTTDGYRMHIYPYKGDALTPGYYAWDDKARVLVMQDAAAIGKEMYKSANLRYPQVMRGSYSADPLYTMSYHAFGLRRSFEWPPIRQYGHSIAFRAGVHDSRKVAICLGLNTAPFVWDKDGNVTTAERESYTAIEAKFFFDAIEMDAGNAVIRWGRPREPVIVGLLEGPHAVIMPLCKTGY